MDTSKGDKAHLQFKVVAEPGEQRAPFRILHWDELQPYLAPAASANAAPPGSIRVSAASGTMREGDATFEHRLLEDSGSAQLIELVEAYDDGDNTIRSRYRATRNTITPVSSRMVYFGYMFSALFHAFLGALVLNFLGRRSKRRLVTAAG